MSEQRYTMQEWKCGKCGKIYTFDEFIMLIRKKVKAVEGDTNPYEEHGFAAMCNCGYRFDIDKWRLHDNVEIKIDKENINILVSTIDLELNHGFGEKNLWYETMIFPGGFEDDKLEWLKCNYGNRYETKEEAINDHNRIINLLKDGQYKIESSDEDKKELIILEKSEDI